MGGKKLSPQAEAERFNARFPVGSEIHYVSYPGAAPLRRTVRSAAFVLSGHTAVVQLEGMTGCVAVSHCREVS